MISFQNSRPPCLQVSYRVFCDRPAIELVDGKPAAAAEVSESDNAAASMDEDGEEAEADKVCS